MKPWTFIVIGICILFLIQLVAILKSASRKTPTPPEVPRRVRREILDKLQSATSQRQPLEWRCSWCDEENHVERKPHYTHGICQRHKAMMEAQIPKPCHV